MINLFDGGKSTYKKENFLKLYFFWAPGRAAAGSALLRFFSPEGGEKELNPSHPWRRTRSYIEH